MKDKFTYQQKTKLFFELNTDSESRTEYIKS